MAFKKTYKLGCIYRASETGAELKGGWYEARLDANAKVKENWYENSDWIRLADCNIQ